MKGKLETWRKLAVALAMLWLHGEAWGVDLSALPLWRQAAGVVLLLVFVEYVMQAAVDDEEF